MLDRIKLLKQIEAIIEIKDDKENIIINTLKKAWLELSSNQAFFNNVQDSYPEYHIPLWQDNLHDTFSIDNTIKNYEIISVDGSQVYPDRHYKLPCFLINIGSVVLRYGISNKQAINFNTIPYVYKDYSEYDITGEATRALVNCIRQEKEFQYALDYSPLIEKNKHSHLIFIDGSLIFWHLQAGNKELKNIFLYRYIDQLKQFQEQGLFIAGYISMPKGKDIINLIRFAQENNIISISEEHINELKYITDTAIIKTFLKPDHRTTIFEHRSPLSDLYDAESKPHFFYLNNGEEIARVETPAWIAKNKEYIDIISSIILDQCHKGQGYPVAIAEAHEQAVIKGSDRDFFFSAFDSVFAQQGRDNHSYSKKSLHKRTMHI